MSIIQNIQEIVVNCDECNVPAEPLSAWYETNSPPGVDTVLLLLREMQCPFCSVMMTAQLTVELMHAMGEDVSGQGSAIEDDPMEEEPELPPDEEDDDWSGSNY